MEEVKVKKPRKKAVTKKPEGREKDRDEKEGYYIRDYGCCLCEKVVKSKEENQFVLIARRNLIERNITTQENGEEIQRQFDG